MSTPTRKEVFLQICAGWQHLGEQQAILLGLQPLSTSVEQIKELDEFRTKLQQATKDFSDSIDK